MLTLLAVTDVEKLLVDIGAVRNNDTRLRYNKTEDAETSSSSKIKQGTVGGDTDDSDWD